MAIIGGNSHRETVRYVQQRPSNASVSVVATARSVNCISFGIGRMPLVDEEKWHTIDDGSSTRGARWGRIMTEHRSEEGQREREGTGGTGWPGVDGGRPQGRHVDLSSEGAGPGPVPSGPAARPFVGIHFVCCDLYARVYVNREETAYTGNCPRCGRPIRIRIGHGGTSHRFFTAY